MSKYLIIGIDPGHTVGVAALDLSGRLVHASHLEAGGLSGAVSIIEKWGTPSLIATDVRPAPETALKLASAFNVPLFVPRRPWREEDKKAAIKQMAERISPSSHSSSIAQNAHERDALSAAIQAWRANQNLLREADSREMPGGLKERFQHLLLQGYRTDFALQKIEEENRPAPAENEKPGLSRIISKPSAPAPFVPPHFSVIERQNIELKKRIQLLEHEQEGASHEMRLLQNGVRERISREKIFLQMQAEITRLRMQLHHLSSRFSAIKRKNDSRLPGRRTSPPQTSSSGRNSFPSSCGPAVTRTPLPPPARPAASPPLKSAPVPPVSLKELDSHAALDKIVSEYRRGRAGPKN